MKFPPRTCQLCKGEDPQVVVFLVADDGRNVCVHYHTVCALHVADSDPAAPRAMKIVAAEIRKQMEEREQ